MGASFEKRAWLLSIGVVTTAIEWEELNKRSINDIARQQAWF